MKLFIVVVLAAVTALVPTISANSKRSDDVQSPRTVPISGQPPSVQPPYGQSTYQPAEAPPIGYPPYFGIPKAACKSNVIAALIGVGALNCANINVLSTQPPSHKRRSLGDFHAHHDPVVVSMLKRAKVKPLCQDPAYESMQKTGVLDCKKSVLNVVEGYKASKEICATKTAALLAAIDFIKCDNIKVTERSTDSEHEDLWVNVMRRGIATRQCERANEDLGVRMIDCSHPALLLPRLVGPLGGVGDGASPDCQANTIAGLIAVGAAECLNLNILSNVPAGQRRRELSLINVEALKEADLNVLSYVPGSQPGGEYYEEVEQEDREKQSSVDAAMVGRRDYNVRKRIAEAINKSV